MLSRYVRTAPSVKSQLGRISLDDTRIAGDVDPNTASKQEVLDAIMRQLLRRAIHARPEKRTDVKLPDGSLMRCVAPRKLVSPIIHPSKSRHYNATADETRLWRATVASKLGKIDREHAALLLRAAELRDELLEVANRLQAARSDAERSRGVSKRRKTQTAMKANVLRQDEVAKLNDLRSIERTLAFSEAIETLLTICAESPEVEAYCLRTVPWLQAA